MSAHQGSPARTALLSAALVGIVCVGIAAAGLWWNNRPETTETSRPDQNQSQRRENVSIIIAGDTAGWIVPCGCTSNQSGGLLRRGSVVAQAGKSADVLVADAGGAAAGTAPYQRAKFEAILSGELAMGLVAHNLGGSEAELGIGYLRSLATKRSIPFISANLRTKQGEPVVDPYRVVEVGGSRFAFVGVLSQQYATDETTIIAPHEAVLTTIESLQGQYDWLIVLAYLPEEELRQLAASLPEADVVVGGPTGQSIAPHQVGTRLLASATKKGKFVVRLDAPVNDIHEGWMGEIIELTEKHPDDERQTANLRAFHEMLEKRDFKAEETGLIPPLPVELPVDYRIAGTAACIECHDDDCKLWEESGHAHAWLTLTKQESHVDSTCQQCHTTGFGQPGGFVSALRSTERVGVGCESCHGPSLSHTKNPQESRTPLVAKDQCRGCHDLENSPQFDFAEYWEKIQHGTSAEDSSSVSENAEKTEAP